MSEVLSEAAHIGQADGLTRLSADQRHPLHCQRRGDGLGAPRASMKVTKSDNRRAGPWYLYPNPWRMPT